MTLWTLNWPSYSRNWNGESGLFHRVKVTYRNSGYVDVRCGGSNAIIATFSSVGNVASCGVGQGISLGYYGWTDGGSISGTLEKLVPSPSPTPLLVPTIPPGPIALEEIEIEMKQYASATLRYFTSDLCNNKRVGLTHAYCGTGKFRTLEGGTWRERELTREHGSHVNINEITLRFVSLAIGHEMNLLNYLPENERYTESYGQIKVGLETLLELQNSGSNLKIKNGHFHRAYWTANAGGSDKTQAEIRRDGNDMQSSDDNGLPFMNLLVLEGLVQAANINVQSKSSIVSLCRQIRGNIRLDDFVVNKKIVFNYENGVPSQGYWDRLSTEGSVLLSSLLLSEQITLGEFYNISSTLENHPVSWARHSGENLYIQKPSYHSAIFMHCLRALHGMPITHTEFKGLNFYNTSVLSVLGAHIDFALANNLKALGSQVMTQAFNNIPVFEYVEGSVKKQVLYPGNEENSHLSKDKFVATGPHAFFMPLSRYNYLTNTQKETVLYWIRSYAPSFFHNNSDIHRNCGWEAAIPFSPEDRGHTWQATDGEYKYTDMGRPYEALNAAYIILSIFDMLNPNTPLASYNVEKEKLKHIANFFDNNVPIEFPPSQTSTSTTSPSPTKTDTFYNTKTVLPTKTSLATKISTSEKNIQLSTTTPSKTISNSDIRIWELKWPRIGYIWYGKPDFFYRVKVTYSSSGRINVYCGGRSRKEDHILWGFGNAASCAVGQEMHLAYYNWFDGGSMSGTLESIKVIPTKKTSPIKIAIPYTSPNFNEISSVSTSTLGNTSRSIAGTLEKLTTTLISVKTEIPFSTRISPKTLINNIQVGSEFQPYLRFGHSPTAATFSNGDFVLCYSSIVNRPYKNSSFDVYADIYRQINSSSYNLAAHFKVNKITEGEQIRPKVSVLNAKDFIVVWQSEPTHFFEADKVIKAKKYDNNGNVLQNEFQVSTMTGTNTFPSVVALAKGGYVITWQISAPHDHASIRAKRYDNRDNIVKNEWEVSDNEGNNIEPSIAGTTDGGYVIAWENQPGIVTERRPHVKKYNEFDRLIGRKLNLDSENTDNIGNNPFVASLFYGEYVVTWHNCYNESIVTQVFTSNSLEKTSAFVFHTSNKNQQHPKVAGFKDGTYVIAWGDKSASSHVDVYFRSFKEFQKSSNEILVNKFHNETTNEKSISLAALPNNYLLVIWTDDSYFVGDSRIFAKIYNVSSYVFADMEVSPLATPIMSTGASDETSEGGSEDKSSSTDEGTASGSDGMSVLPSTLLIGLAFVSLESIWG